MSKKTTYKSKPLATDGSIQWTEEETSVWKDLVELQLPNIEENACVEYRKGLDILSMSAEAIPQIPDLNKALGQATGWAVEPVPCLIPFSRFFELLATKRFPCATFIRRREDLQYIEEPDIFHEVFGHCPMLTDPHFAEFTHRYGQLGLAATPKQRVFLARLYWFTAEFGMIHQHDQWKFYGGGIMSSPSEAQNSLSDNSEKRLLDAELAMRTFYKIDEIQPIYYFINSLKELSSITNDKILEAMTSAMEKGIIKPQQNIINNAI